MNPHYEPWTEQAVCRSVYPDLWFPDKSDVGYVAEAKQVCGGCPVKAECLAWALEHNERHGVWGGATFTERLKMRQAGRVAA